jgi:hypothetical protein
MAKKKNLAAVALGKRGGEARSKTMTAEERSESARKAGLAGGRGRRKSEMRRQTGERTTPGIEPVEWRVVPSQSNGYDGWFLQGGYTEISTSNSGRERASFVTAVEGFFDNRQHAEIVLMKLKKGDVNNARSANRDDQNSDLG